MGKIPTLKKIDFEKGYFDTSKHRYYIQNSLSFNRFKVYQRMQFYLAYEATPEDLLNYNKWILSQAAKPITWEFNYELVNRAKNYIEAYEDIKIGEDRRLVMCTLFANREDEDITVWDEKLAISKISDWSEDGYDVGDFFFLWARLSQSSRVKYMKLHGLTEEDVKAAEEQVNHQKEKEDTQ